MIFLFAALAARVILDLFMMRRSSWTLEALYSALFAVVGCVLLVNDTEDVFGYVSIAIASGSAARAAYLRWQFKRA